MRKRTKEQNSWRGMMDRCYHPSHRSYHLYGGRGIKVCKRWHTYANFLADMGPRPDGLTLDRIDVNKGYSPKNCRWATRTEQSCNKRNNVLAPDGELWSIKASKAGVRPSTLYIRVYKLGWSWDRAVTVPPRTNDRLTSIKAKALGLPVHVYQRMRKKGEVL